jgi:hypothetical protein
MGIISGVCKRLIVENGNKNVRLFGDDLLFLLTGMENKPTGH